MSPADSKMTPIRQEWVPLDKFKFPVKKPTKRLKVAKTLVKDYGAKKTKQQASEIKLNFDKYDREK